MVMQSIGLSDAVELEESEVLVVETDNGGLAGGPGNLAWKAATLLAERCGQNTERSHQAEEKIFWQLVLLVAA